VAQIEYGLRLLVCRLVMLAGFVGVFGFALAAVLPGGDNTTFVILAILCAFVAVGSLTYVIGVHRRAQGRANRRPEDVTGR
jgi:membrane protein implicated in regulation of membrane protease activity